MIDIVFTGGGTAGHVTPNIALIDRLQGAGWHSAYIGSRAGIEREMIRTLDLPYYPIFSGKLRRYFSLQNFVDPLAILLGFFQALFILLKLQPRIIFSKGGFVSVPVVYAGWLCRIPVVAHESDITPGLANRLAFPVVKKICVNFPETSAYLPPGKSVVTGSPVRRSLLEGKRDAGRAALSLEGDKPLVLVFGGSLGAATINACVRAALDELGDSFDVVHVTGVGNLDDSLSSRAGYIQREFISAGFGDVLAAADVVVSRAGANSLYELLALRKPHVLVPLPLAASRGDQLDNARVFASQGMSLVIEQASLTPSALMAAIKKLYGEREAVIARLQAFKVLDATGLITDLIQKLART